MKFVAGFLTALFGYTTLYAAATEIGGRQWNLRLESQNEILLSEMKKTNLITWCFESVNGRGLLKDFTVHLRWENHVPELTFAKDERTASAEDRAILSCLDATLKEFPPHLVESAENVRVLYTIKRRR